MIHQQCHILLCVRVKALSARDDIADEFMILFNVRLLPGGLGIAEEQTGSKAVSGGVLKAERVFKLNTVIGKDDRKEFAESSQTQMLRQVVKHSQYACLSGVL